MQKNEAVVRDYSKWLFMFMVFVGIVLHAVPYIYNRSLWIDEAMLASSLLSRNFWELLSYPLDWGQGAPAGYLYVVKSLTILFGHHEYVLRMWSLFSFICCVFLLYFVMKSLLRVRHPGIFTLVFTFLPYYMRYSNEFKPYMSDNMFVLLALLLFGLWHQGRLKFSALIASYSVIIWFSFASVFFVASAMIITVIEILCNLRGSDDKSSQLRKLCACMIVALSFIVNYLCWLSVSSSHMGGAGYFALTKFIFFPSSLMDIKTMYKMLKEILMPIISLDYTFSAAIMLLAVAGAVHVLRGKRKERKELLAASIGSVLLLCIASSIGFYPIGARLLQFISIEILIFSAVGFDVLEGQGNSGENRKIFLLLVLLLLLVPFFKTLSGARPSKVYFHGSEVAENVRYLKENLTPKDFIYVSGHGTPVFLYENNYSDWEPLHGKTWGGYGTPFVKGNRIFGQTNMVFDYKIPYSYEGHLDIQAISEDISLIVQHPSVYLFSSHNDKGVIAIAEGLKRFGNVEEVTSFHGNPLYHFRRTEGSRNETGI